jgi:hypothetical protein
MFRQPGVETCSSFILASECVLLSAYVGWCVDCKDTHGVSGISKGGIALQRRPHDM